ncbi:hypothetical protein ACLVWQ_00730 [Streptomyces sp. CWNU-52B]|uniref:hypothetical protein n=1 Tax=unclassified Streptomyces TaxID=2593676 RepID=UPI0039BF0B8B
MAASAQLLLSALSKRPADVPAEPASHRASESGSSHGSSYDSGYGSDLDPHYCVFSAEGSCAEAPLTSEPPLPDAAPLTSEPPLADAAPLTSEPTSTGAAAGLDPYPSGV